MAPSAWALAAAGASSCPDVDRSHRRFSPQRRHPFCYCRLCRRERTIGPIARSRPAAPRQVSRRRAARSPTSATPFKILITASPTANAPPPATIRSLARSRSGRRCLSEAWAGSPQGFCNAVSQASNWTGDAASDTQTAKNSAQSGWLLLRLAVRILSQHPWLARSPTSPRSRRRSPAPVRLAAGLGQTFTDLGACVESALCALADWASN